MADEEILNTLHRKRWIAVVDSTPDDDDEEVYIWPAFYYEIDETFVIEGHQLKPTYWMRMIGPPKQGPTKKE